MRKLLLALMLLFSACDDVPPLHSPWDFNLPFRAILHSEAAISGDYSASVDGVVAAVEQLGGRMVWDDGVPANIVHIVGDVWSPECTDGTAAYVADYIPDIIHFCSRWDFQHGTDVQFPPEQASFWASYYAFHEMGHVFGMGWATWSRNGHLPCEARGVMSPSPECQPLRLEYQPVDVATICRTHGIINSSTCLALSKAY